VGFDQQQQQATSKQAKSKQAKQEATEHHCKLTFNSAARMFIVFERIHKKLKHTHSKKLAMQKEKLASIFYFKSFSWESMLATTKLS